MHIIPIPGSWKKLGMAQAWCVCVVTCMASVKVSGVGMLVCAEAIQGGAVA